MPTDRPSILHVAQPVDYGVARVAATLIRDQVARGWEVTIACPPGSEAGAASDDSGARRIEWQASRSPGPSVPGEVRRLAGILRSANPDVVHLHSAKAGLAGRLALRGRRPTIFQPHAWSFAAVDGPLRRATETWERTGARWSDAIVCVSDDERAEGERVGVSARYAVIPNGVDLTRYAAAAPGDRKAARADLGLDPAAPLAVLPARIFEQKGQDVLLDAWPAVLREVPDARLVLVGDGPQRDEMAARAVPQVDFVPPTDRIPAWLAAANVVVFPSRWEAGLSLGVMEAMARGRTVVATEVWGTRDGLGSGGGAIVPIGAVDPLGRALAERLGDPDRADAEGAAGRKTIEERYDIRLACDRMAELALDVLARRQASSSS